MNRIKNGKAIRRWHAKKLTYAIAGSVVLLGGAAEIAGFGGPAGAASSSPTPSGTSSASELPSVDAAGTYHYPLDGSENSLVAPTGALTAQGAAAKAQVSRVTLKGTIEGGVCTIPDPGTVTPGSSVTEEEIAYNPTHCWSTYRDVTVPAAAPKVEAAASCTTTCYKNAYFKSAYLDPLDITITSLSNNLGWAVNNPYNSYVYGPLNAIVVPYKFKWDQWSQTGPETYGPYKWSNYSHAEIDASADYTNTDFENYLLSVASGIPGGDLVVLAACEGYSTAVFDMDAHQLTGDSHGNIGYNSTDTKSGGCSDLVHRDAESGYGSSA